MFESAARSLAPQLKWRTGILLFLLLPPAVFLIVASGVEVAQSLAQLAYDIDNVDLGPAISAVARTTFAHVLVFEWLLKKLGCRRDLGPYAILAFYVSWAVLATWTLRWRQKRCRRGLET